MGDLRVGLFALVLILVLVLAMAVRPALAEPLKADVKWKDPTSVNLEIDFPGDGYHASWQLFRCSCGDLLIRSELVVPGEVTHGDILLVANRAVLMHGYAPEDAEQISFDAPALMMQLVMRLLERAEPAGPAAISERRKVDVEDAINYINLDTGVAAGGFPAPWRVQGSIWPQAETQRRFDLTFTFNAAGPTGGAQQQSQLKLAGFAEFAAADFPLSADTDLQSWDLSWRDENDTAAAQLEEKGSLADLRRLLSEDRKAGDQKPGD